MTIDPPPRDEAARRRLTLLLGARALGVVLMLLGLGLWLGGWVARGDTIGPVVFIAGGVLSFLVPAILARRWRTPLP